jgi:hypothetical protein
LLCDYPDFVGPFGGTNAAQQCQDVCGIEINTQVPIVFTHDYFVAPNILLSPGPNSKVTMIIDWVQTGWYPAYWEYCKARRVGVTFSPSMMLSKKNGARNIYR